MSPGKDKIKILGLSGSLRGGSFNTALLRVARELAPESVEIEIHDLHAVPFYDGDVEEQGTPVAVAALRRAIDEADAVLVATPEYNHGTSGVLKNAIDWASRPAGESVLTGKPVAIMGVGAGGGTRAAQAQVRASLEHLEARVIDDPEVAITNFWERFDESGELVDEEARESIGELVARLVEVAALEREPALAA
jgi:chromate reductase